MIEASSSIKRWKTAPRRHLGSVQGLMIHSRQLHHVLKSEDEPQHLQLPRTSTQRSTARSLAPEQPNKPIVFRKTKRELQREEECALKLKHRLVSSQSSVIRRINTTLQSAVKVTIKRMTSTKKNALVCTKRMARRRLSFGMTSIIYRCPPRRRLNF